MARPRRRQRGFSDRPWLIGAAVALLVLLLAGGAWLWLRSGDDGERSAAAADVVDTAAAPDAREDSLADLPELEASDSLVRDMAERLSSRPQLAEWLVTDDLVRRFVGTVVQVGAGLSPRAEVEFLEPDEPFRVREQGGSVVVDPASYERYDGAVETFVALDTEGAAQLYRRLSPLFEQAYRDLGFRQGSFDAATARAVERLLAVPVPEGPVELVPVGGTAYEYRDPELEALSPAQRHLLRMGPENARRVQDKLEELSDALELPTVPQREREEAGPDAG